MATERQASAGPFYSMRYGRYEGWNEVSRWPEGHEQGLGQAGGLASSAGGVFPEDTHMKPRA